MKKRTFRSVIAILLALILGALAGCGSTDTSAESTEAEESTSAESSGSSSEEEIVIRVGYFNSAPWNAAFDVAYQAGFYEEIFADDNVTVEAIQFANGPAANEAFLAEEIDFVYGIGDQPVLTALNAGQLDVQIVAGVCVVPEMGLIVAEDSGIDSIEDLKGKKISVYIGTAFQKALLYILSDYGISESDIELVNISDSDTALAALSTGEIDAAFVTGYSFSTAEERGLGIELCDSSSHPMYTYLEGTTEFLETYPDLVEKFLEATIQGQEYLEENPEEGYELLSEFTGIDVEQIEITVSPNDFTVQLTDGFIQNLYDTSDFLYEQGLITERVSEETIDAHIADFLEITE